MAPAPKTPRPAMTVRGESGDFVAAGCTGTAGAAGAAGVAGTAVAGPGAISWKVVLV